MSRRRVWLAGGVALILAGCGGGETPTPGAPTPAPGPVARPPAAPALPKEPEAGPALPAISYEAKARRDPFQPVVLPTETGAKGLSVDSVKLTGVIQGRQGPLALVEGPDGIGYILRTGDVLGNGRVTQIGPDAVNFTVAGGGGQAATTVTLRLRTD
jgi:Tfp pilus assembly protein PilP